MARIPSSGGGPEAQPPVVPKVLTGPAIPGIAPWLFNPTIAWEEKLAVLIQTPVTTYDVKPSAPRRHYSAVVEAQRPSQRPRQRTGRVRLIEQQQKQQQQQTSLMLPSLAVQPAPLQAMQTLQTLQAPSFF